MEYYNYKGSVKKIIREYFEEDIINEENYVGSSKIKIVISDFTNKKFDWSDRAIFRDFLAAFSDFKFDNQTHFYCNDRCLQVYAEKDEGSHAIFYTIWVSVFNFFGISQRSYTRNSEDRLEYEPLKFIDRREDGFADGIFEIVKKYYSDIRWLPKDLLTTNVSELEVFSRNLRKDVIVADLIFTQNK